MRKLLSLLGYVLIVGFFCSASVLAQAPALPDVPVSHVVLQASFSGYDSGGKMSPATNDVMSLALTNQTNGNGFNVAYQHIQIPDLGQRWEMGLLTYHGTVPKLKSLVFDTSNLVYAVSAGVGKFLSNSDGNHIAWTVSGSLNYPVSAHTGWQLINYQYVYATGTSGNIHGTVSSSQITTGPMIYF